MDTTTFNQWVIPDENKDPWYVDFVELIGGIDAGVYALQNTAGNVIIPLGTISWDGSYKRLSWTDDFLIPIIKSGFFLRVKFGPDGVNRYIDLNEGDRVYISVPTTSATEVTGLLQKTSGGMFGDQTIMTFGYLYGNKFYANLPTVILP